MKGAKFVLYSGIVLAIYGGINIVYCIILWLGASSFDPTMLEFNNYGYVFIGYLFIQGLVPFIVGGLGLFWHNKMDKVKVVYILAWILLIVEYALFFMTYGQDIYTILFSLGCILVSLVYYYGADKNLKEKKEFYRKHKIS